VRLSTNGGFEPLWARSGNEVFYRSGNSIMSVAVRAGSPFNAGRPQTLFIGYNALPIGFSYDVAPDGRRFVMLKSVDNYSPPTDAVSRHLALNRWSAAAKGSRLAEIERQCGRHVGASAGR
jgi:hypothetical protein